MALPPSNRQGTGYTNLGRYLTANKGSRVGQALQSGVQGNINEFNTGLNNAQQGFQKDVQGNVLGNDSDVAARTAALNKIGTLNNPNQVAGEVGSTAPIITQGDIDQFGKFRAGAYKGPQGLNNEAGFLGQSQNLQGIGQETKTEGGRQALLQQYLGKGGQYNQGAQKLDSLILGQQANKLGAINKSVQGLAGNTSNQINNARDVANLQAAKNAAFGKESQGLVDTQYKTQADTLDPNNPNSIVAKDNAAQTAAYQQALADAQNNQATNSPYFQSLAGAGKWNVDPINYLTQSGPATAGNVITPEQRAQMIALSKLAGSDVSQVPDMTAGDRYGTGFTNGVKFNEGDYSSQVKANQDNFYNNVLPNYKQTVNGGGFDPDTGQSTGTQTMSLPDAAKYYTQLAQKFPAGIGNGDYYKSMADKLNSQYQDLLNQQGANTRFK